METMSVRYNGKVYENVPPNLTQDQFLCRVDPDCHKRLNNGEGNKEAAKEFANSKLNKQNPGLVLDNKGEYVGTTQDGRPVSYTNGEFVFKEPSTLEEKPTRKEAEQPLNVRYNNLGNIKNEDKNDWVGQTNTGSNDVYAKYLTPELGVRALVKVMRANLEATSSYEAYVDRYASEDHEKAYYKKHGKLHHHLQNYAKILADSHGVSDTKSKPKNVDIFKWIKATSLAEGGTRTHRYFTDDVIKAGIKLATTIPD